ncbi:alkylation response protein AidB-like acyl-CoA dehydrogenase [Mycolicibacterium sp. BK556]|uniref:acyl-CoA dehydrogenase family protein n=1 Tax=unclassified Mycolicibacterium TaxID=2636767 RepID=UPI00160FE54D|nr:MULTISPECIES: acyl-CoA dehydrogenase family protein [unclassified Mycolicibacterium]MBB3605994.1 alkylation response protein AidB-like acyl-CoA dehydrogenase [Mycolicibacterium sp. BK556]MBB3632571.1 alkylation response protein AidB-like acyl-CoA dehydrogenase [Mycolicibacterium sp. BK607]
MHWELSDEQNLYAESVREWLAARAGSEQVRMWLDAGDHHSFDNTLVADGWAAVGFDESLGGQGGGLLELALTARELGRCGAPSVRWLARAITDVPELTRAALDAGELTTVAVRSDRIPDARIAPAWQDGRVSGQMTGVLAAAESDRFLLPVTTPGGDIRICLVTRESDGVDVRPRTLLDRSRAVGDVLFDSAEGSLLELDAPDLLNRIANRAAVLTAADTLGAAERMLDMSVEYTKQRKQFGKPIAAFQAVKHASAQMLVTVEAGYSVALFAAASLQDDGPDAGLHAAAAKAQVSAQCAALADSALTVHGAIGYTWEYDLQLFYKRAKLNRVLYGSPAAWNERVASMLPILPAA